jgi:hypothetical protein
MPDGLLMPDGWISFACRRPAEEAQERAGGFKLHEATMTQVCLS